MIKELLLGRRRCGEGGAGRPPGLDRPNLVYDGREQSPVSFNRPEQEEGLWGQGRRKRKWQIIGKRPAARRTR